MEIETRGAPAHTRTLCVGVAHEDATHVQAKGVVLDLRKRGLVPMAGDLQTSGLIHHMQVDARVALAGPRLETIHAEQPSVAFEPSEGTGGECCRDPVRRIEALAGSALDADFARRLGAAIGGPLGCSHVLTLAQLLGATTRTALEEDAALHGPRPDRAPGQRIFDRSLSIDGLDAGDRGLSLSLQLADVHFGEAAHATDPFDRLDAYRQVRVHADVDLSAMKIEGIRAAARSATGPAYDDAPWEPRDVTFLEGQPALGGMARTLFARLGDTPADRPLLDTLLNLAPALIQCVPALTSQWKRWRQSGGEGGGGPSMMAGGGMVDSCYMWRREGVLQARAAETLAGFRR